MPANKKEGSTASLNEQLNADIDATAQAPDQDEADSTEYLSYNDLKTKLVAAEEKANKSWDRALRIQAEMDNMQRRAERDVSNAHKYALEKFVLELLPIVDGLERALQAHANDEGENTLLDGVGMTIKMLQTAFEKFGIQAVNPENQPFNPELHQAVSIQEDPAVKPGTVLVVLQKGYLLNNRLIRPAMVVVAKT